MSEAIHFEVERLEIGEPTIHSTLTVFPVLGEAHGPEYITLHEAMQTKSLSVTELGGGAQVPHLEVSNGCDRAVLILDGEILVGAKQNRTLNTTVLLAPQSKTVVPVSCVEAGRWSNVSAEFLDSDAVVPHRVRHAKSRSVAQSLERGGGHLSDQGEVWSQIHKKLGKHRVHSPSSSMSELYHDKQRELEAYLEAFSCDSRQRGLVVALGGCLVGGDILSRPAAYAQVHRRLLKGFAAEDLERSNGRPPVLEIQDARDFLREVCVGKQTHNPGVGLGSELRFETDDCQGTALYHEEAVLHAVFLREERDEGPELPIRRRRRIF